MPGASLDRLTERFVLTREHAIRGRMSIIEQTGKATFGAGCFWHVEAAFASLEGVLSTAVGYMGGTLDNPTYDEVCSDESGHAEVVQVYYDPARVSYDDLLELFWEIHDPTTLNRQGPDIGSQYRSVIFFHDADQEKAATSSKRRQQESGQYAREIVTEIVPVAEFYRAEDYHQQYFARMGLAPNCGVMNSRQKKSH